MTGFYKKELRKTTETRLRQKLERFDNSKVTKHIKHPVESCPVCGGEMELSENDELDCE